MSGTCTPDSAELSQSSGHRRGVVFRVAIVGAGELASWRVVANWAANNNAIGACQVDQSVIISTLLAN